MHRNEYEIINWKTDLELLLEKKRDLIGNKVTIDTIVAGISFFVISLYSEL